MTGQPHLFLQQFLSALKLCQETGFFTPTRLYNLPFEQPLSSLSSTQLLWPLHLHDEGIHPPLSHVKVPKGHVPKKKTPTQTLVNDYGSAGCL